MTQTLLRPNIGTLWYTRCPVPTPLGLASQLGWFDDEFSSDQITIRTLQDNVSADQQESHFDHNLSHSFRQGGNIPAIWARSRGRETRVIGLTWTDEYQGIIALPGSKIKSIKDLRGRKLGLPVNPISIDFNRATALRSYLVALDLEGLSHKDVQFVNLPRSAVSLDDFKKTQNSYTNWPQKRQSYAAEVLALGRGDVDAIFVKGALGLETTRVLGATIVTDIGFHPDPLVRVNNGSPRTLTVDQQFLDDRPDLVKRFLRHIVRAGRWAADHPTETVAYIAQETGSTADWVRAAYGNNVHLNLKTELLEDHIDALADFKDSLLKWGFLEADFNAYSWIDHEPLAELAFT